MFKVGALDSVLLLTAGVLDAKTCFELCVGRSSWPFLADSARKTKTALTIVTASKRACSCPETLVRIWFCARSEIFDLESGGRESTQPFKWLVNHSFDRTFHTMLWYHVEEHIRCEIPPTEPMDGFENVFSETAVDVPIFLLFYLTIILFFSITVIRYRYRVLGFNHYNKYEYRTKKKYDLL
jgi:hypothetical protein